MLLLVVVRGCGFWDKLISIFYAHMTGSRSPPTDHFVSVFFSFWHSTRWRAINLIGGHLSQFVVGTFWGVYLSACPFMQTIWLSIKDKYWRNRKRSICGSVKSAHTAYHDIDICYVPALGKKRNSILLNNTLLFSILNRLNIIEHPWLLINFNTLGSCSSIIGCTKAAAGERCCACFWRVWRVKVN